MDYIFGRCDAPQGKLYQYQPKIWKNAAEMEQFVEMCFDPKSPYYRKVDAVPFQAQYLAAAQAVQRGDIDDRVEALVFDGGQQIAHLCFRVERAGKLRCVRHDDQIGGICLDQTVSLRQFERLIEHVLVLTQAITADRPPWPSERPNLAFTLMYVCSASPSTSHSRICRSSK